MLLLVGLAGAVAAATAIAQAGTPGSSEAVGYAALLPGGAQAGVSAASVGPAERSGSVAGLRPAGGGAVAAVDVRVGAAADGASAVAEGNVQARGITLLDGRVAVSSIRMSARASNGPGGAQAGLTEGSVEGLVVDGSPVAAGPGARVDVAGIGTLVFLEQVTDGAGGVRANALRLEVTDAQAAALIGRPFVIGHLDLSAAAGAAAAPDPEAQAGATPDPTLRAPREEPAPAAPERRPGGLGTPPTTTSEDPDPPAAPLPAPDPLGLPRREAPAIALPDGAGYVFPVFGDDVGFGDDYGAPRAGTGWHHGNDLFAPTGTPVLAVADGTLGRVGINRLGGNRLWLTDEAGNQFYYAHLSAYAPAAVEGARVRAGQVIGFVGNTGQAITTPPHLHFEIHPAGGDSVNPYPYLVAWQRGTQIPRAFRQAAESPSPAPAIGAVLVDGTPELDVSPVPGDGLATPVS